MTDKKNSRSIDLHLRVIFEQIIIQSVGVYIKISNLFDKDQKYSFLIKRKKSKDQNCTSTMKGYGAVNAVAALTKGLRFEL